MNLHAAAAAAAPVSFVCCCRRNILALQPTTRFAACCRLQAHAWPRPRSAFFSLIYPDASPTCPSSLPPPPHSLLSLHERPWLTIFQRLSSNEHIPSRAAQHAALARNHPKNHGDMLGPMHQRRRQGDSASRPDLVAQQRVAFHYLTMHCLPAV